VPAKRSRRTSVRCSSTRAATAPRPAPRSRPSAPARRSWRATITAAWWTWRKRATASGRSWRGPGRTSRGSPSLRRDQLLLFEGLHRVVGDGLCQPRGVGLELLAVDLLPGGAGEGLRPEAGAQLHGADDRRLGADRDGAADHHAEPPASVAADADAEAGGRRLLSLVDPQRDVAEDAVHPEALHLPADAVLGGEVGLGHHVGAQHRFDAFLLELDSGLLLERSPLRLLLDLRDDEDLARWGR